MRDQKLIIADGHHRYETAWPIATSGKLRPKRARPSRSLRSVMMTFVDMDRPDNDRPGLVILPTHRLVFGLPSFSSAQFQEEARKFFNVKRSTRASMRRARPPF